MNSKPSLNPEQLPVHPQGGMLDRRQLAGGVAAATALTALSGSARALASTQSTREWQPKVLKKRQLDVLERLVDTLIPRTDTPGAADAEVHRYIDEVLSTEPPSIVKRFSAGIDWFEKASKVKHGSKFARLSDQQVVSLVTLVSDVEDAMAADGDDAELDLAKGRSFFSDLKSRTVFGYYTSKLGRVEELDYPEGATTSRYRGCDHSGAEHGD